MQFADVHVLWYLEHQKTKITWEWFVSHNHFMYSMNENSSGIERETSVSKKLNIKLKKKSAI